MNLLFCLITFSFDFGKYLLWHCFQMLLRYHKMYFCPVWHTFSPGSYVDDGSVFFLWDQTVVNNPRVKFTSHFTLCKTLTICAHWIQACNFGICLDYQGTKKSPEPTHSVYSICHLTLFYGHIMLMKLDLMTPDKGGSFFQPGSVQTTCLYCQ